jgi:ribonucleotide reductase beta subunit family protein with ferritin-like domain
MAKSIINTKQVDYRKEPLFFGEPLSIQRYDQPKYEKLFNMFKQQISYMWRPEEINLSRDKSDFQSLSEHEKFIFTTNLSYQILLDSVQSRGISYLLEDCSNPEVEAFAKTWEFFETLHSYSYTYIIKQIYTNPTEVFDAILQDPEVIKRTGSVTKYYDSLINSIPDDTTRNRKKKLYLTLVSINILEGIRFYVSFACSYCFAQNKKMEGNAKIISLINRDENLHMGFTSMILKYLAEDSSEGFQSIVKECEHMVIKMYKDAADEEIEWAKYLFRDGAMIGLNADILIQYMKWLTNSRMKMIKLEPAFDKIQNPISWITNWTESKSIQEAPQETEIVSYTVGAFKQDSSEQNYDEFEM